MLKAAIAIAPILLLGCTSQEAPRLTVTGASVRQVTDEGVVLAFTMEAENLNDKDLPLLSAEYDVELNGQRVFSGRRSPEATLRRYGTHTITLPAALPLAQWPGGALEGGTEPAEGTEPGEPVEYRLRGRISFMFDDQLIRMLRDTGLYVPSTRFSGEGVIGPSVQEGGEAPAAQGP